MNRHRKSVSMLASVMTMILPVPCVAHAGQGDDDHG